MKKHFLVPCIAGILSLPFMAQAQFTSGNSFYIQDDARVSIDGLVFIPSGGGLLLTDKTITVSAQAVAGEPNNSINRVFTFDKPIDYTGFVGVVYNPSELNGNTEAALEIAYFNDAERYVTVTGSEVDVNTHFVMKELTKQLLKVTATSSKAVLPVNLVTFSALKSEQHASLKWSTTFETNSDFFEVQRSANGKSWEPLGHVAAAGESKVSRTYLYDDVNPLPNENLYRLKMVDKDGTFAFSKIISLHFESGALTSVYPNPVAGKLSIQASNWQKVKSIDIFNALGRPVSVAAEQSASSPLVKEYDFQALPTGIYMIRTTERDGQVHTMKVVKQ